MAAEASLPVGSFVNGSPAGSALDVGESGISPEHAASKWSSIDMKKLRGALVGYGFIMEKGHAAGYRQRAARRRRRRDRRGRRRLRRARASSAQAALPGRAHLRRPRGAAGGRGRAARLRRHRDAAQRPRRDRARGARPRAARAVREAAGDLDRRGARRCCATRAEAERVLYPCHNYKHAPVIKTVRGVLDAGRIGKVHLVTLQTFRNTHAKGVAEWRTDWRRERRYSGGGIAMDHGSHTFYLAFEWLRRYPTAITRARGDAGRRSTPRTTSPAACRFPTGVAVGAPDVERRRAQGDLHDPRRARRDPRRGRRHRGRDRRCAARGDGAIDLDVRARRRSPPTGWTRATSPGSTRCSTTSRRAIARRDFVGKEAREAFLCVQLIATAYASAREGCRELPLRAGRARGRRRHATGWLRQARSASRAGTVSP